MIAPFHPLNTLRLGAAVSDRIVTGTANGISGNLCTMVGWFMPTTLTSVRKYFGKANAVTSTNRHEVQVRADGSIRSVIEAGATDLVYSTTATGLAVVNLWMFLAVILNTAAGAGLRTRFFVGYRGIKPSEYAVTVTSEGTGPYYDGSTDPYIIGNDSAALYDSAFQGLVGPQQIYNRALTIDDIEDLHEDLTTPVQGLVGYWNVGSTGVQAIPDLSGFAGHGLSTGCVPAEPLILPGVTQCI